jgi:SAM-dependent methyltransferase
MTMKDTKEIFEFGKGVDFGPTAKDYREFRAGFPDSFFQQLSIRGLARERERALDLGTGTGTLARGLARLNLSVVGVDPAAELIAEARALDRAAGVDVDYVIGRAEALGLRDASFDLATAGQCWHWFDRGLAASELARVLRPGGRLVIAHFDWLPLEGNVVEATEMLILKYNPAWSMSGGTGIYPDWLRDLALAGFSGLETFSYDTELAYGHEAWRGRIRASAGVRASLDERRTREFDQELAGLLHDRFSADPLVVPHRVWAAVGIRNQSRRT